MANNPDMVHHLGHAKECRLYVKGKGPLAARMRDVPKSHPRWQETAPNPPPSLAKPAGGKRKVADRSRGGREHARVQGFGR